MNIAGHEVRELPSHAVAVVGIGCRFPQADGPGAFWRPLRGSGDALTDHRGGHGPQRGGFLDRVDESDPEFFGISHREAMAMDPQQRLALELAWEALENARILPGDHKNSRNGRIPRGDRRRLRDAAARPRPRHGHRVHTDRTAGVTTRRFLRII
ncbi:beta-ketoacyl synthase N-terminal-like domain-containing protein [Streptomyces sp. NPDC102409]|uniref:beta-ketoacyl synthase N-terminal-like domain-containing protein n=1 Tax=Streptomyces sp. NPDC102409 TaxID=3366172 RepID=UPI00382E9196